MGWSLRCCRAGPRAVSLIPWKRRALFQVSADALSRAKDVLFVWWSYELCVLRSYGFT
jgi:hypothetical protein